LFEASGLTEQGITSRSVNVLSNLRDALTQAADLQAWMAGIAVSDLVALGFSTTDANAVKSACADGEALFEYYQNGKPPGTYPQPASAYVYGASQRQVIGP
jgi:hypothetical protein